MRQTASNWNRGALLPFMVLRRTLTDYATGLLRNKLSWLRVPQRIIYKLCLITYKALNAFKSVLYIGLLYSRDRQPEKLPTIPGIAYTLSVTFNSPLYFQLTIWLSLICFKLTYPALFSTSTVLHWFAGNNVAAENNEEEDLASNWRRATSLDLKYLAMS